jgi:hypothetical protein
VCGEILQVERAATEPKRRERQQPAAEEPPVEVEPPGELRTEVWLAFIVWGFTALYAMLWGYWFLSAEKAEAVVSDRTFTHILKKKRTGTETNLYSIYVDFQDSKGVAHRRMLLEEKVASGNIGEKRSILYWPGPQARLQSYNSFFSLHGIVTVVGVLVGVALVSRGRL